MHEKGNAMNKNNESNLNIRHISVIHRNLITVFKGTLEAHSKQLNSICIRVIFNICFGNGLAITSCV